MQSGRPTHCGKQIQQLIMRWWGNAQAQQEELKRQQVRFEEHERQREAEQAERRRQEDQDRAYAQEQLCYKGACQFAAGQTHALLS